MHRKAHLGRLRRNAQLIEQANEMRVGPVVEDDETGVQRIVLAAPPHIHGMGVATDPVGRFVHRDLMPA
ncbi:hypothetical protein D3C76_1739520 [compost metagenome]